MHTHTRIGRFCQIGARSIIMPGLTVGDHSVVLLQTPPMDGLDVLADDLRRIARDDGVGRNVLA
jgi:hypothetical protein